VNLINNQQEAPKRRHKQRQPDAFDALAEASRAHADSRKGQAILQRDIIQASKPRRSEYGAAASAAGAHSVI
jgi:hypothetical protein